MIFIVKNPPSNAEHNLIFHLGKLIIKYLKYKNFMFLNYVSKHLFDYIIFIKKRIVDINIILC